MPVAEILAGIALVKSSVDFIKSNIDTCKDIGELGSAIDSLLRGKDEASIASELKSLKKIGKTAEVTTRLKYIITSVNDKQIENFNKRKEKLSS